MKQNTQNTKQNKKSARICQGSFIAVPNLNLFAPFQITVTQGKIARFVDVQWPMRPLYYTVKCRVIHRIFRKNSSTLEWETKRTTTNRNCGWDAL